MTTCLTVETPSGDRITVTDFGTHFALVASDFGSTAVVPLTLGQASEVVGALLALGIPIPDAT